jgi:hypothetical protein
MTFWARQTLGRDLSSSWVKFTCAEAGRVAAKNAHNRTLAGTVPAALAKQSSDMPKPEYDRRISGAIRSAFVDVQCARVARLATAFCEIRSDNRLPFPSRSVQQRIDGLPRDRLRLLRAGDGVDWIDASTALRIAVGRGLPGLHGPRTAIHRTRGRGRVYRWIERKTTRTARRRCSRLRVQSGCKPTATGGSEREDRGHRERLSGKSFSFTAVFSIRARGTLDASIERWLRCCVPANRRQPTSKSHFRRRDMTCITLG